MLGPGAKINQYRIIQLIGQGGFGAVYKATHEGIEKTVALKQMTDTSPGAAERFQHEARLLANLDHSGLPKVTDHFVDQQGSGQFLVMEYVSGMNLAEYLQQHGDALQVATVIEWSHQLLKILTYLHAQQPPVIHRDIKPQNIKLTQADQIKLLDFGLAKHGLLNQGSLVGDPSVPGLSIAYAPPEQFRGRGTDERSDIYGLAATLYTLLTRQEPANAFVRTSHVTTSDPLLPPHVVNPQISIHISNVLMQALALEPEHRFASIQTMHSALYYAGQQSGFLRNPVSNMPTSDPDTTFLGQQSQDHNTLPGQNHARIAAPNTPRHNNDATVLLSSPVAPTHPTTRLPTATPAAHTTTIAVQPNVNSMIRSKPKRRRGLGFWFRNCLAIVVSIYLLISMMFAVAFGLTPCGWLDSYLERSGCIQVFAKTATIQSVTYATDGTMLASSAGNTVQIWDATDGRPLRATSGHTGMFGNQVTSVAFSPDGSLIASGGQDDTIRIWRVADATLLRTFSDHRADVRSVTFSPDGQTLVSASDDGTIKLWQAQNGELVWSSEVHTQPVTSVAFSPDGSLIASGGQDDTIQIVNTRNGTHRQTLQAQSVLSVAFSPDGTTLASGSADGRVRIWNVNAGSLDATLEVHSHTVTSVAFSPDGILLASGADNGVIQIWNLEEDKLIMTKRTKSVQSLAFAPGEQHLASGSKDGHVRLWQITP